MVISISMYSRKYIQSFRDVVVHNADLVHLTSLLGQHFPDLPSLALDLRHAPGLLSGPCIGQALHLHLDNVAIGSVLRPARFEEFVCFKF